MSGTRTSNLPETFVRFSDSIHEPAVYEDQIKARLQTITTFVEGLNTSTVDLLLAEKPFAANYCRSWSSRRQRFAGWFASRPCQTRMCAPDYGAT